jgi:Protein of unknown function (DUF1592)
VFARLARHTPPNALPGTNYRIGDVELAARLSCFLWSSTPDDRLLNLAIAGHLHDPKQLETEVRRMLADPRSEALVNNFAGQWLYLRNLKTTQPDIFTYPNFDDDLPDSMRRETELFFGSMMREDRNVTDLQRLAASRSVSGN